MTTAENVAPAPEMRWAHLAHYAAPALVILAMVVAFFRYHEYSMLLPESLIILGLAAGIGVALGAIGRLRPDTLGPAGLAVALTFYTFYRQEIHDGLLLAIDHLSGTKDGADFGLDIAGVGLFLVIFVICIVFRRHLALIVTAVFGTIALTTLVLPVTTGGEPKLVGAIPEVRADLPPVVHIILDEHIGLDSLPEEYAASAEARETLLATFQDFELHSRAYSRFAETIYSLTSLMNGNLGDDVRDYVEDEGFYSTTRRNEWFEELKRQGYAIKVYQTSWYDLCGGPGRVDACYTYSMFSTNAMQRTSLSVGERLRVLATKIIFSPRKI